MLFGSKHKTKNLKPLYIRDNDIKIKQYSKVTYLGRILDENRSGESMITHGINKINSRLRFHYQQNRFLNVPLRKLLCNSGIQPMFDYACNTWYPNVNKNLEMRLQVAQNKCKKFWLNLNEKSSIKSKDFKKYKLASDSWKSFTKFYKQCIQFFTNNCPNYFDE